MASLSRASCDIASKMVTGRSAKTLFMEVMESSAAGPGRQSGLLPTQDAPCEMLVVGKSRGLRRQRGRDRAFTGAAGEHHLLSFRIGNRCGIKGRKRNDHGGWISLGGDFVRPAATPQEIAPPRHSLRYSLRHKILPRVTPHATILQRAGQS